MLTSTLIETKNGKFSRSLIPLKCECSLHLRRNKGNRKLAICIHFIENQNKETEYVKIIPNIDALYWDEVHLFSTFEITVKRLRSLE